MVKKNNLDRNKAFQASEVIDKALEHSCYKLIQVGKFDEVKKYINVMNSFTTLDISQDVADLAADLYRLDKFTASENNTNKNIDKRQFDIFHFATAKVNNIELLSNDKHLPQFEKLYTLYEAELI